ncbi:MAG: rRNA maturation RNase YbeY [Bryobacteraceae bacterium]
MSTDDIPLLFPTPFRYRKAELRQFHADLKRKVLRGRGFTCLITSDAELKRLNKRFLGKNYATDVLSFPAPSAIGECGDVAISVDRAKAQAAEHRHSVIKELLILMLHGALHLAGYDHETDNGEMRKTEAVWRKRLELPSGLIERAENSAAKLDATKASAKASAKARAKKRGRAK